MAIIYVNSCSNTNMDVKLRNAECKLEKVRGVVNDKNINAWNEMTKKILEILDSDDVPENKTEMKNRLKQIWYPLDQLA